MGGVPGDAAQVAGGASGGCWGWRRDDASSKPTATWAERLSVCRAVCCAPRAPTHLAPTPFYTPHLCAGCLITLPPTATLAPPHPRRVESAVRMKNITKQMHSVSAGMESVLKTMDPVKISHMMDNFEKQVRGARVWRAARLRLAARAASRWRAGWTMQLQSPHAALDHSRPPTSQFDDVAVAVGYMDGALDKGNAIPQGEVRGEVVSARLLRGPHVGHPSSACALFTRHPPLPRSPPRPTRRWTTTS